MTVVINTVPSRDQAMISDSYPDFRFKSGLRFFIEYRKTPFIVPAFNLKFFFRFNVKGGYYSLVCSGNDHFRAHSARKSAPKRLFYIFDFGTYQLIVTALNLKTEKIFKG
jgi:hypothetical protein